MLNLERSLVNAESQYHRNEIEYRKLEHLQSQLDSFSGLGTLIAGFVFVTLNADLMDEVADGTSKFCMFKQPGLAHIYIILTLVALCLTMSSALISMYISFKSQQTANEASVRMTIALVRAMKIKVMVMFFVGMSCFMFAYLASIWLFLGAPNWQLLKKVAPGSATPYVRGNMMSSPDSKLCNQKQTGGPSGQGPPNYPGSLGGPFTGDPACDTFSANGFMTDVITTSSGDMLATCLNPGVASDHKLMQDIGLAVIGSGTATFFLCFFYSVYSALKVRSEFGRLVEIAAAEAKKQQQQQQQQ